jgi:hypothetical protein
LGVVSLKYMSSGRFLTYHLSHSLVVTYLALFNGNWIPVSGGTIPGSSIEKSAESLKILSDLGFLFDPLDARLFVESADQNQQTIKGIITDIARALPGRALDRITHWLPVAWHRWQSPTSDL